MTESHLSKRFFLFLIAVLLNHHVQGQSNKVSSKLDFDDDANPNNSSVPIVPGGQVGQARGDDQNTGVVSSAGGGSGTSSTTGSGGGGKSGPKIHGVRVTVDTGDTPTSKESKESVEITDVGKHKKRVGIHTDITFEITADGDEDVNATSSAQRQDKEDASVPIYKGRGGGGATTHKPRKPYDPKSQHWNPNFSSERRGYDSTGRGGSSYGGHYPPYAHNIPVYTGTADGHAGSGSVYRSGDGWTNYVPSTSRWTTERTYSEPYRPNAVTGYRAPSWKPCYCMSSGADNRRRRESHHGFGFLRPTSAVVQVIDGKLESPFS